MRTRISTLLFGSVLSATVLLSAPSQAAIFGCDEDDLIRSGCSDGDVTGSIGSGSSYSSRDARPEAQDRGSTRRTVSELQPPETPDGETQSTETPSPGPGNPDYQWMDDYKQRYTTRHLEPWNDYGWMNQYKDKYRELAEQRWAEEGGPKDDLGWMDDEDDTASPAAASTASVETDRPLEGETTETAEVAGTDETSQSESESSASENEAGDTSGDADGTGSSDGESSEGDSSESETDGSEGGSGDEA